MRHLLPLLCLRHADRLADLHGLARVGRQLGKGGKVLAGESEKHHAALLVHREALRGNHQRSRHGERVAMVDDHEVALSFLANRQDRAELLALMIEDGLVQDLRGAQIAQLRLLALIEEADALPVLLGEASRSARLLDGDESDDHQIG